jgi:methyl-accepting chemotaxis protein
MVVARRRRRFGILARLALSVYGGFALLLAALVAVLVTAISVSMPRQAGNSAGFQLPYARLAVTLASGGPLPRREVVAAVQRQLALTEPSLRLRVFDHGKPVGEDLPLDDLDRVGLASVTESAAPTQYLRDPAYTAGRGGFRAYVPLASDPEVVLSLRYPVEIRSGSNSEVAKNATAVLGLVMLLICSAQYFVLRRTTRRITRLSAAVARMAATSDFTTQVPQDDAPDEIGELREGVRALADALRTTANTLQQASYQLADAGQALTRSAAEQSQLVQQYTQSIEEAASSAEEIRQTSETASQRAEEVLDAAARAGELGDSGEHAVRLTLEAMGEIRAQVMEMGEQISVVAERAHQISGITQSVKDIADSSNMLALNASIEAVRSGEQGKGFALVAREMRTLADQSIKATERVREILDDVSVAIQQASTISSRGTQRIETGLGQLTQSGESVRALAKMISESSQSARVVAAAVRQQNAGIVQIVRSIADQRALAERTSEVLTLTQTHADALQALTRQVSELLKSYRI